MNSSNVSLSPIFISLIGTTSCGKSTIGNLLSGRFLLPSGVQETTTSVLELHHTPKIKAPTMYTSDSLEGHTVGESDETIRKRLSEWMSKTTNETTTLRLFVPFREGNVAFYGLNKKKRIHFLSLSGIKKSALLVPHNSRLILRDMPGILHMHDVERFSMIRELSQHHGGILFIFNAEETDCFKEDMLLKVLLQSCREAGFSHKRILFVINRVDAFLRNENPKARLNEMLENLKNRLSQLFAEFYGYVPPSFSFITISAEAMACCEALYWSRCSSPTDFKEYDFYIDALKHWVVKFLPEQELLSLPRSPEKWTNLQWRKVCLEIRKTAHYSHFFAGVQKLIDRLVLK